MRWFLWLFWMIPVAVAGAQGPVDIEEIAESVVLLVAQTPDGESQGSGTVIDPSGLIYTNRHVVEGTSEAVVLMLDDVGDLPQPRYQASVVGVSESLDFAILQIDRDANGNPLDPASLALNAVPFSDEEMRLGDAIRVFGYPGLGEGYLVVTSGEIVTVQDGDLFGDRLPVWYWTDTEFSGGNSGGLVINEAGEFVGIPTWVRSEGRTAGRLGGVLPSSAIQAVLERSNPSAADTRLETFEDVKVRYAVKNVSDTAICEVYISPTTAEFWGDNQLGASETIAAGGSRDFSVQAGFYDVLLVDCDGFDLQDLRTQDLTVDGTLTFEGASLFAFGGGDGVGFTLRNDSDTIICFVQFSLTTASEWGEDRLDETEILRPGAVRAWTVDAGVYDLRLLDCDVEVLEEVYDIDLNADNAYTFAG